MKDERLLVDQYLVLVRMYVEGRNPNTDELLSSSELRALEDARKELLVEMRRETRLALLGRLSDMSKEYVKGAGK